MFENILGMLRKRRRLDEEADATGGGAAGSDSHSTTSGGTAAASMFASGLPTHSNMNMFWDSLFGTNDEASNTAANNTTMRTQQPHQQLQQAYHGDSNNTSLANNGNNMSMCINRVKQILESKISHNQLVEQEDMEIDPSPVPPPQEYSDNPAVPYHSESSMNFDYLHSLHADSAMDSSNSGSSSRIQDANTPSRHFAAIGGNNASSSPSYGQVDESRVVDRPFNLNERFVTVLDQLDARVEKFRKDALGLQEKRDFLLMSMDLIKSNDLMQNLTESEREEISCYIQRVNSRLSTVELNVRTVRDQSQEDSLCQINSLIDLMITMGDPVLSRQRCQMYLNACCSARESGNLASCSESGVDMDAGPIDKKFESVLLGCTLDDQKNIKKRLQALMGYLNKQIIHH